MSYSTKKILLDLLCLNHVYFRLLNPFWYQIKSLIWFFPSPTLPSFSPSCPFLFSLLRFWSLSDSVACDMDKTYRRNKTKDDHGERATSAKGTKVASPRSPLLPATATVANESLRRAGERRPPLQLWREGRSFALFKALPNKMSGPPCVEPSLSGSTRRSTVPTTPCLGWLG